MFSKRSVTARRCRWNTAQADTANIQTDVSAMCSINATRWLRRNQNIRIEASVLTHRNQRNLCVGTDMAGTSLPDPSRIPRPTCELIRHDLPTATRESANRPGTYFALGSPLTARARGRASGMHATGYEHGMFRFYALCRAGSQVVSMCPRFSQLTSPLALMPAYSDRLLHATSYYSPHP